MKKLAGREPERGHRVARAVPERVQIGAPDLLAQAVQEHDRRAQVQQHRHHERHQEHHQAVPERPPQRAARQTRVRTRVRRRIREASVALSAQQRASVVGTGQVYELLIMISSCYDEYTVQ